MWFRNDEIPCEPNYEIYTLTELLEATKDCNVTQMAICGSGIPPLTEIFPYLKRLRLTDVSILDQRLYYKQVVKTNSTHVFVRQDTKQNFRARK